MVEWQYGLLFDSAKDFLGWLKTIKVTSTITATHVHHTYNPSHKDFRGNNHREIQDAMRNFHMKTRGWSDIGQHLTIFPDGKVMTGRNINRSPASATNYNGTDSAHPIMFEMIGNFDAGHDVLQGKQLESAVDICKHFGNVVFHRECLLNGKPPKSCPGTGIDKGWFMSIVKGVKMEGVKKEMATEKPEINQEAAQKVIDVLSALWFVADDAKIKEAAHYAAEALREAVVRQK